MFRDFKTEIKLFLAVAFVAVITAVGVLFLLWYREQNLKPWYAETLLQLDYARGYGGDWPVEEHLVICKNGVVGYSHSGRGIYVGKIDDAQIAYFRENFTKSRINYSKSLRSIPKFSRIIEFIYKKPVSNVEFGENICLSSANLVYSNAQDTSIWQTYRNEEFGFEVKVPPAYAQEERCRPKMLDKEGNEAIIGEDLSVFIGPITVHQEKSSLSLSQYVDQKVKNINDNSAKLSVSKVVSRENTQLGGKEAIQIISEIIGASAYNPVDLYATHDGQVIRINYDNGIINQCAFDGFNLPSKIAPQIISTFRFVGTSSDSLPINAQSFCAQREGQLKFEKQGNFDSDESMESMVICATSQWERWPGDPQAVLTAYILDEGNRVLWQRNTDADLSLRSVSVPEFADIDRDGVQEVLLTGSNWGGTCTGTSNYYYVYSPAHSQLFSMELRSQFDASCEILVRQPAQFSENLQRSEFAVFKRYLEGMGSYPQ